MTQGIVAVTGASGQQSGAICRAFAGAGWRVRGLARDSAWVREIAEERIERCHLLDYGVRELTKTFRGVDAVVLNAPVDYRTGVRESLASAVRDAAVATGVRRIILNTGAEAFKGYPRRISQSLFAMREILDQATVPLSVVQPTMFMENMLAPPVKAGILAGRFVYPVPATARIAWISHDALASAVVAAAESRDRIPLLRIGGPAALTAEDIAEALSAKIGRAVQHEALAPDHFARMLPPSVGEHIADYYRRLEEFPDALARNEGVDRLGVRLESFEEWVSRQAWRDAAGGAP